MAKKLGEVIVERDWAVGKLKCLDLSIRKELVNKEREGGYRSKFCVNVKFSKITF